MLGTAGVRAPSGLAVALSARVVRIMRTGAWSIVSVDDPHLSMPKSAPPMPCAGLAASPTLAAHHPTGLKPRVDHRLAGRSFTTASRVTKLVNDITYLPIFSISPVSLPLFDCYTKRLYRLHDR